MVVTFTVREDRMVASGNAWGDGPRNHDPALICGHPHSVSSPRVKADGSGVDTAFAFCVAPAGDHGLHPLARSFTRATPCQVLLHAPLKGPCRGYEVGYWLEGLREARQYARRVAGLDVVLPAGDRSSLDYWMGVAADA